MKSDLHIAREAEPLPIRSIAAELGIADDALISYGTNKAKLSHAFCAGNGGGRMDLDLNDLGGTGLSVGLQGFSIGADYVSVLAARREADVLLGVHPPSAIEETFANLGGGLAGEGDREDRTRMRVVVLALDAEANKAVDQHLGLA